MVFGAWFCVGDATFLLTARAARHFSPVTVSLPSVWLFPSKKKKKKKKKKSMKRRTPTHAAPAPSGRCSAAAG